MPPALKQTRTSVAGLLNQNHSSSLMTPHGFCQQQQNHLNHQHPHCSNHHNHHQNEHYHQQQQQQSSSSESGNSGVGRFSCPYAHCPKSFDDLTKFKEHNRSHQSLKPFRCRYGRCSATSSKKGNLRRHIRQVHKSVKPVDADLYIEQDQGMLEAEEAIYAAKFCTRKRWNGCSNGGNNTSGASDRFLSNQEGDLSSFDSSDFDSSSELFSFTAPAELCITSLPIASTSSTSSTPSSSSSSSFSSSSSTVSKMDPSAVDAALLPPSATAAQFSTIVRSATGYYLCPFAGGCQSAFYDVSHLKIHYRVHTALMPFSCTWSAAGDCRFESTRKGNVVRHIRVRHLPELVVAQKKKPLTAAVVDPFDYVKTRTEWIKWEDALFERATVLSLSEYQQQQQLQLQNNCKKKSSAGVQRNASPYFPTGQASSSSSSASKRQRSSAKRKQAAMVEAEQQQQASNIDWGSIFSQN